MPTTAANVEAPPARPEYFRLPRRGRDPHFNFSRSFFYEGAKRRWWPLIHIKAEGKSRGIVLVRYQDVLDFIRAREAEAKATPTRKLGHQNKLTQIIAGFDPLIFKKADEWLQATRPRASRAGLGPWQAFSRRSVVN